MTSATLSQFKLLFPTTVLSSKLSPGKVSFKLKLKIAWGSKTLNDLSMLVVNELGDFGNHLHLSKIEDGCIAVWLGSTAEVKQMKMAIYEAADSLQTMGILQAFIRDELVLDYSATGNVYHHDRHAVCLCDYEQVTVIIYCGSSVQHLPKSSNWKVQVT